MSERSSFWTGTAIGDAVAAPYDAPNHFSEVLNAVANTRDKANDYPSAPAVSYGGVFSGHLNELKVTPGVGSISVATGRSIVYGAWHQSDTPVSFSIPTPSGATRRDRVIVRKDWTTQTVRLAVLQGVEGGSQPALVRTLGDKYDISICILQITTAGVITVLFDTRVFIPYRVDPLCEIYRATDYTIAGVGSYNVPWEFSRYDTHIGISFDAALNPTRLIVPRSGLYRIYGLMNFSAPSPFTAQLRQVSVWRQPLGGTLQRVWNSSQDYKLNDNQSTFHWSFNYMCNEGDYFYVELNGFIANALVMASTLHEPGAPTTYPTFSIEWKAHNPAYTAL